jgi:hypothetical protein
MQSMAIRGFISHNRESGLYTLADSGRATLGAILENAGPEINPAPARRRGSTLQDRDPEEATDHAVEAWYNPSIA